MENKWWSPSIYDSIKSLFLASHWKEKGFPNFNKNNIFIREHIFIDLFPLFRYNSAMKLCILCICD